MTTRTTPARSCPSGDATARRVTVRIPMVPAPALSPNMRSRRGGHYEREAATRELREAAWAAVYTKDADGDCLIDWTRFKGPVQVHEHIIWPKSKGVLPDPDSIATYCKPALDGIVDAGLIAGDSHRHIASVTTSQEKGADPLGWTVITIEEAH